MGTGKGRVSLDAVRKIIFAKLCDSNASGSWTVVINSHTAGLSMQSHSDVF